jgi:hypothetical protein
MSYTVIPSEFNNENNEPHNFKIHLRYKYFSPYNAFYKTFLDYFGGMKNNLEMHR